MVSSELIQKNPKAVQGFVRAMNRAFREMLAEPEASVKALNARDPLTEFKQEMERLSLLRPAILTSRTKDTGLGHVDMPTLEKQIEYVASSVQLKAKPSAEQIFNASFLPPLRERLPLK
jgi:NitT/TauT family transport system substrate-binding protein